MKRKLIIGVMTGLVLFGGVVGVGALASEQDNTKIESAKNDIKVKINKVDDYLDDDRIFGDDSDIAIEQIKNVEITKDEAIKIATDDTPGEVAKVELDDDGYYEIDVVTGQAKVEYKIDANTGEILSKEHDDDRYDDDWYDDDRYDDDRNDDKYDDNNDDD
ncbi:PepSY domain-containing protein [Bacillus marasmi]|uniref:PepSY domain-containing protein n=1 Tax=Bacillus marasmi TaxID=1926279 RepID=UPI00164EC900|nr:PepSY domain-containing protein [Bacillus marasmi]